LKRVNVRGFNSAVFQNRLSCASIHRKLLSDSSKKFRYFCNWVLNHSSIRYKLKSFSQMCTSHSRKPTPDLLSLWILPAPTKLRKLRWKFGETQLFSQPLKPSEFDVRDVDRIPFKRWNKLFENQESDWGLNPGRDSGLWKIVFKLTAFGDRRDNRNCERLFGIDESDWKLGCAKSPQSPLSNIEAGRWTLKIVSGEPEWKPLIRSRIRSKTAISTTFYNSLEALSMWKPFISQVKTNSEVRWDDNPWLNSFKYSGEWRANCEVISSSVLPGSSCNLTVSNPSDSEWK
jgi:hypothetical protein